MTPVDDELLSAYLDGELEAREARAVEGLLRQQASWRQRLQAFRTDSEQLRSLAAPPLSEQTRDIVYRSVKGSFPMGAERRRVPRYKRRWMLLAAFAVPCFLTLLYLQSPARDARLYLRGDQLTLRAGRSGPKSVLPASRSWTSPPLWGTREGSGAPSLSFQVDGGDVSGHTLQATIVYDFDGDSTADRTERYETARLDGGLGWERFGSSPIQVQGELRDFRGGTLTLQLTKGEGAVGEIALSGSPAELVLPYQRLRTAP